MISKLLIGCYTSDKHSDGLHLLAFNDDELTLNILRSTEISNPSYVCISSANDTIYAVNENHEQQDSVTHLSFDLQSQSIEVKNIVDCGGSDPCHISTDSGRTHAFVSNYSSGSLSVFKLDESGNFLPESVSLKFPPEEDSARKSHIHATLLTPDERFLIVTNLGLDELIIYSYSCDLQPCLAFLKKYKLPEGTGPRHILFSKNGVKLYVVGELNGTVNVFDFDEGELSGLVVHKLMPDEFAGINSAADIHMSVDQRFLYVSNRGDANQIIGYSINLDTFELERIACRVSSGGIGPRNFAVHPTGKFLFVANQHSNSIRIFNVDEKTGALELLSSQIILDNPVFVKFFS